jgi:hypothetical protein
MKAIVFDRAGEPDQVLRLDDVSEPEPRADEQLVKDAARPIHPADLSFIRGQYRIRPSFPQVAGLEGMELFRGTVSSPSRTTYRIRWLAKFPSTLSPRGGSSMRPRSRRVTGS